MGTNLRERRRKQTARDIQLAAVEVSLRCGYENTTTEAIAAQAGISTRTFFNYYNNKQAAILGEAVRLDPEMSRWFVTAKGPLVDDIAQLLGRGPKQEPLDRDVLRKIIAVIDANPVLRDLFRKRLDETTLDVARLLSERLGDDADHTVQLVAELSTHALAEAVAHWATDDEMTIDDVTGLIASKLRRVATLLSRDGGQTA